MEIIANEYALPIREGWQTHASNFLVLPGNRILLAYFYGSREGNSDVRIYVSRREEGICGQWSEPQPVSPDDGIPHWNPVLHRYSDGTIALFYKVSDKIYCWKTYIQISKDEGLTWSEPQEMIPGDNSGGRGPVRNKILKTASGRLVCGGSTELSEWLCFFDLSDDEGKTWRRTSDIALPELHTEEYLQSGGVTQDRGIIQPTLWEDASGIHALMRSTQGYIYRTDSADDGETWCDPYRIELPNNNSGIDLDRTDDGSLVLAYNPVNLNWGVRSPLSLAISKDDGKSWQHLTHLVTSLWKPVEYSYPCVRWQDGCLHITFTWNRQTINYMCIRL